jgi:sialate O-acetylesterase
MPFCIISLCTDSQPQTLDNFLPPMFDAGIYIREAHYKTFCDLRSAGDKGIGFVSSFDLRKAWYHPQIKIPAGERAAKWALATRYGLLKGRDAETWWLPPTIEKVEIADGTMRLTMSTEVKTHDDSDGRMLGFAIAGKDRRFYPAEINWFTDGARGNRNQPQFDRKVLVLSSRFVPQPLHYRYAWARNPMGNIVNNRGVPLAAQRSDDWILEETPVKITLPPDMPPDAARRQVANQILKELERDDLERRVKEAEATILELKPLLDKANAERDKRNAKAGRK